MARSIEKRFFTIEPCASARAYEIKFKGAIDLKKAEARLGRHYEVLASSPVMLMLKIGDNSVTLYGSGRALIKYVTKEKAEGIGRDIAGML